MFAQTKLKEQDYVGERQAQEKWREAMPLSVVCSGQQNFGAS